VEDRCARSGPPPLRTVTAIFLPYEVREELHPNYWAQLALHPNYWAQLALHNCLTHAYNSGTPTGGTCTTSGEGLSSAHNRRLSSRRRGPGSMLCDSCEHTHRGGAPLPSGIFDPLDSKRRRFAMKETLELQTEQAQPAQTTRASKVLPGIQVPVLLQTLRFTLDPEGYFAAAHRRYGDVFTMRVLGQRWVVVAHPDAVKEVLALGPEQVNSGESNQTLAPVIGRRNVLLLDGEEHLHRRRIVLPAFHGERMRAYEEVIREAVRHDIAGWPLGEPVAALPRMQALTFTVIMRCVFGVDGGERMGPLGNALRDMIAWVTDMRRVLFFFLVGSERLNSLRSFRRQLARVDREILAEISRRRAMGDLREREDILSLLIQATDEDGEQLSDGELRDELMTLLIAGHETTATLLSWAIHDLARDPAGQDRLSEEGGAFCDAVINETLRLHPPTGAVVRSLREPLTIAGYDLPAGTSVLPATLLVHRRADLYPEPWAFRPTRFLDTRPPAGGWFPFGGSVRRCIGASFAQFEAKIVLEELTGVLRLRPVEQRPERTGRRAVVLIPANGARVIAERR
jgi:cytochrome P450